MEIKILEQLKRINKEAILNKSFYSYTTYISGSLLTNDGLLEKICSKYGITEEDLLQMLCNPSYSNLSLLDEMSKAILHKDFEKHL